MNKYLLTFLLCFCVGSLVAQQSVPVKPRVLISTDIGGTDPDDNQSMAHLLMYTDKFDIEGLVSSPSYGNGSKDEILRMIDLYEKDLPQLKKHQKNLLSPEYLRSVTKQGVRGNAPYRGYRTATEGSDWIIKCARKITDQPLWILGWGGLEDLAQALHDAPEIQEKIRVYWIGGPNKKWSANSYAYIAENFPNLWFIEVNSSYYGFFSKSDALDSIKTTDYYDKHIQEAGYLGKDFKSYYNGEVKMGDTPSLLYMMDGDPDNPARESWGGSFENFNRSSRVVLNRVSNITDTVSFCTLVEFQLRGPQINVPKGSVCFMMETAYGNTVQKWPGYYLGNGKYGLKYVPKQAEILSYRFTSSIPDVNFGEGKLVVTNLWPGRDNSTDFNVGKNWYTDRKAPDLYDGKIQGGKTVSKWRKDILSDWAERWSWLQKTSGQDLQADNMLLFQRKSGGWSKQYHGKAFNYNIHFSDSLKADIAIESSRDDANIDNKSTTKEIVYLIKSYKKYHNPKYLAAAENGIRYLLKAQYKNGGWPQYYPENKGYRAHITYNDDAMANVISVLQDVALRRNGMDVVSPELIAPSADAVQRGLDCILKTQIRVSGQLTGWCQQYDRVTLKPAKARAYELPSIAGSETVSLVKILIDQPTPSKEMRQAIQGAVNWLKKVKITDYKVATVTAPGTPRGIDRKVVAESSDTGLWARYYEIGTNRPFFCDRDGIKKYSIAEIGYERRVGYAWYGSWASQLLEQDYPAWLKREKLTDNRKS